LLSTSWTGFRPLASIFNSARSCCLCTPMMRASVPVADLARYIALRSFALLRIQPSQLDDETESGVLAVAEDANGTFRGRRDDNRGTLRGIWIGARVKGEFYPCSSFGLRLARKGENKREIRGEDEQMTRIRTIELGSLAALRLEKKQLLRRGSFFQFQLDRQDSSPRITFSVTSSFGLRRRKTCHFVLLATLLRRSA